MFTCFFFYFDTRCLIGFISYRARFALHHCLVWRCSPIGYKFSLNRLHTEPKTLWVWDLAIGRKYRNTRTNIRATSNIRSRIPNIWVVIGCPSVLSVFGHINGIRALSYSIIRTFNRTPRMGNPTMGTMWSGDVRRAALSQCGTLALWSLGSSPHSSSACNMTWRTDWVLVYSRFDWTVDSSNTKYQS
jgi:hypothetical protein